MSSLNTRVLVTGGAGFLGSHLCDRLIKYGNDVLCVDNFFTGSKANIAHLIGNPGEFTMQQLAETILRLSGTSSKLVNKPLPQDAHARDSRTLRWHKARWDGHPGSIWKMGLKKP